MRPIAFAAAWMVLLGSIFSIGYAVRIEIDTGDDPNARLEIRTLVLPDGSETDLYVIEAEQIVLTIDGDRLSGSRIEFNAAARIARVIGRGSYQTDEETIEGSDLTIAIDAETFRGSDVLVVTGAIDVIGDSATRIPGQISVLGGRFSPCSRCDQEVEDYGFRAQRIELYPGDRLIAFEADVLIRGRPIFRVPLLVIPLAPPDRQPRLSITRGTATERAEVAIDWPYVAGANGLGMLSVRYWADIDPGTSAPLGFVLGGAVERNYLGGGIDHRFYTERGQGRFEVFYTPGFVAPDGASRELHQLRAVVRYETIPDLPPPALLLLIERDDARRDRLVEYQARLTEVGHGVRGTLETRGFIALRADPENPSYLSRSTPLQTVLRLQLQPEELPLRESGLSLDRLLLDLGAFEDISNSTNRSAAITPTIRSGRAVVDHRVDVTQQPWTGFEVRATNDFVGRYYGTGERLIDWQTDVRAAQRVSVGRFEVTYRRDVNEGETPFRFDQIPLRNRADVSATLQVTPLNWIDFSTASGWVFMDTRSPDAVGIQPVVSSLRLFGPVPWIDLSAENTYDPKTGDLGSLDTTLSLQATGEPLSGSLTLEHDQDLSARAPRTGGDIVDTTETRFEATGRLGSIASLDVSGGYRWVPPEPAADEARAFWQPLELGATVGTLGQSDAIPGLRVSYRRDLNTGETLDFGFEAAARVGPVTLEASERIDPVTGRVTQSRMAVGLPGWALLEGTGIVFVPASTFGFREDPEAPQQWSVKLRHLPETGPEIWSTEFATVLDPTLESGTFRDTTLQGRFRLQETRFGASRVQVDLFLDAKIADALASTTYLRRASLDLAADLFSTVGVQGSLAYRGVFDESAGELRTAQLTLDDLTVTARVHPDVYAGARLDDIWELAADVPQQSAFNLQPTLFVAWDRCCWALFGEWNTATGVFRIALTTPGGETGIQESLDTPLTLPGRGTP